MRVTSKMMTNRYLRDANTNLNNLQKLTNQLTSGKEISRPSDNPYKVARSMQLNTSISTNKQYNENIKDTLNWLDSTDEALSQVSSTLERIRTLMVSAGNAAYGTDERNAIANEVNERIGELSQILNTSFDGKYIFGGTKTTSTPVNVVQDNNGNNKLVFVDKNGQELELNSEDKYTQNQLNMINSKLTSEISQGVSIEYNINSMELLVFKDSDGNTQNTMNLLSDIITNLTSSDDTDAEKITGENLNDLDKVIQNVLKARAEVGAKQNRMESAEAKNEEANLNMTDILSKTEDIDFTEKMIQYSTAQTVYQAALQVSAKILPSTLLDYL